MLMASWHSWHMTGGEGGVSVLGSLQAPGRHPEDLRTAWSGEDALATSQT